MKKTKCITPRCNGEASARGLCLPCYHAARRFILAQGHTWDDLIKAGRASPKLPKETAFHRSQPKIKIG